MLSPRRLAEIMADLAAIGHVKIIRIHTRVPVADPRGSAAKWSRRSKTKGGPSGFPCTPTIRAIDRLARAAQPA